jgi:serine protease
VVEPTDKDNIDWREAIEYYDSLPEVLYAEPDYYISVADLWPEEEKEGEDNKDGKDTKGHVPNDPRYGEQWHFHMLNMEEAWAITMGESEVKVAIIDTGVAFTNEPGTPGLAPDLAETTFDTENAQDYTGSYSTAYDGGGHGTHVAGTVAQSTDNNKGVAGMAENVTILPLKVILDNGYGPTNYNSVLAQAITDATDAGADIINMSLISDGYSTTVKDACAYAYYNNVAVFAASGNGIWGVPQPEVAWPAGHDGVIAIGSLGPTQELAYYSNYGLGNDDPDNFGLDLVAPGGDQSNADEDGVLQNTHSGNWTFDYHFYQGTSMATPHAVGLAALMKSVNPLITNDEIEQIMKDTAVDLGSAGVDEYFAYGMINPLPAIVEARARAGELTIESYEGTVTRNDPQTHVMDVVGLNIALEILNGENLKYELLNPGGEVIIESTDTNFDEDIGAASGEYTLRISISNE